MSSSSLLPPDLHEILDHFDDSWNKSTPPLLDEYLLLVPPEKRLLLLHQLILVDLERRLKCGEAIRVEDYLKRFPELAGAADALAELIKAEYQIRRQSEPRLTLEEYQRRFPDLGKLIAGLELLTVDDPGPHFGRGVPEVPGYQIERELGRGGMGVLYLARQARPSRTVALKMLLSEAHASAAALQRFRAEAEAIAHLQHPGIVQVFEVGDHQGLPFFSLEFCPGGSLHDKLAGVPLPPREAAAMVESLRRSDPS